MDLYEIGKKSCNAHDLECYAEYEAERRKVSERYYGWTFPVFFEEVARQGKNVDLGSDVGETATAGLVN